MKKIRLTGEQAYNFGRYTNLYRKNLNNSYELITFESYENDGFIIARNEYNTLILREHREYTFYSK